MMCLFYLAKLFNYYWGQLYEVGVRAVSSSHFS